jgi:hypothetical protein
MRQPRSDKGQPRTKKRGAANGSAAPAAEAADVETAPQPEPPPLPVCQWCKAGAHNTCRGCGCTHANHVTPTRAPRRVCLGCGLAPSGVWRTVKVAISGEVGRTAKASICGARPCIARALVKLAGELDGTAAEDMGS